MTLLSMSCRSSEERPSGVREVMGSIHVVDSEFFFVPRLTFSHNVNLINHFRTDKKTSNTKARNSMDG